MSLYNMPQVSPMLWLMLFLMIICMCLTITSFNYYNKKKVMKPYNIDNNYKFLVWW